MHYKTPFLHAAVYKVGCRNSHFFFKPRASSPSHRTRFTLKYCSHYSNLVNDARVDKLKNLCRLKVSSLGLL